MTNTRQFICALAISLASTIWCGAADHYVTQSGAGTFGGTNLANAWSLANFNNDIGGYGTKWAFSGTFNPDGANPFVSEANPIQPDDTVRFSGAFSGQIIILGQGTNGHPVTLLLESDMVLSNSTFANGTQLIKATDTHDIVVDGITTNRSAHITVPDNGWGKSTTNTLLGVYIENCDRMTVQNLKIGPLVYREPSTDENEGGVGIKMAARCSDINILSNYVTFAGNAIEHGWSGPCTNININYNTAVHCSEGIKITFASKTTNSYIHDAKILYNRVNIQTNWDVPGSSSGYHQNGVHIYAVPQTWTDIITTTSNRFQPDNVHDVYQGTYNADGICVIANVSLIPDHWIPGINDYRLIIGLGGVTNANFLSGSGPAVSFWPGTNYLTLYGASNAPVTAMLYRPYAGSLDGLEIGWNHFGPIGSVQQTGFIFVGDECPWETTNVFIHDNLIVFDTNSTFASHILDVNGNGYLIAHNTIINSNGLTAGNPVQVINGRDNRVLNNLTWNFKSAVNYANNDLHLGQTYFRIVSETDYNNWGGIDWWRSGGSLSEPWPYLFENPAFGGYYTNGYSEVYSSTNLASLNPAADWAPLEIPAFLTGTNLAHEYALRGVAYVGMDGVSRTNEAATMGAFQGVNTNEPPLATYTLTLMPGGETSSRTNTESVTITCTNAGLFNGWTATAGSITAAGNCSTTFTMPAQDCTVTAAYTNAPVIPPDPAPPTAAYKGKYR